MFFFLFFVFFLEEQEEETVFLSVRKCCALNIFFMRIEYKTTFKAERETRKKDVQRLRVVDYFPSYRKFLLNLYRLLDWMMVCRVLFFLSRSIASGVLNCMRAKRFER